MLELTGNNHRKSSEMERAVNALPGWNSANSVNVRIVDLWKLYALSIYL